MGKRNKVHHGDIEITEETELEGRLCARMRLACVQWGNAIEHSVHSVQTARALMILKAITGNLDSPGGNVNRPSPPTLRPADFVQSKSFPEKREQNTIVSHRGRRARGEKGRCRYSVCYLRSLRTRAQRARENVFYRFRDFQ